MAVHTCGSQVSTSGLTISVVLVVVRLRKCQIQFSLFLSYLSIHFTSACLHGCKLPAILRAAFSANYDYNCLIIVINYCGFEKNNK